MVNEMENVRDIVKKILNEIDDEILEYDGDNLIEAGLLDSFTIVSIMSLVEEQLHITISSENVKEENFKTIDAIVNLIERLR